MKSHISAVRVTMNNARTGKNGVFLADHNNGKEGKAAKMGGLLWQWAYDGSNGKRLFSEVEADYYAEHFVDGLEAQNAKHRKKGNKKRVKTMDEYRTHKDYCPESTLFYVGDKENHADVETIRRVVAEFLIWRRKRFPQVVPLDWAMHIEDGAPHIHERHVWLAHDEYGNEVVNQGKALEEMGVLPPDLEKDREAKEYRAQAKEASEDERKKLISKAKGIERYNNAKIPYTAECREKLQEIARSYGLEIITEPREKGQQGRTQSQYITDDLREKAEQAKREATQVKKAIEQAEQELMEHEQAIENAYDELGEAIENTKAEIKQNEDIICYQREEIGNQKEYIAYKQAKSNEHAEQEAKKAREEREELARNFREEQNDEIIDMSVYCVEDEEEEQETQNAREHVQKAPETTENEKPIPDTLKAQTPLKTPQRRYDVDALLQQWDDDHDDDPEISL